MQAVEINARDKLSISSSRRSETLLTHPFGTVLSITCPLDTIRLQRHSCISNPANLSAQLHRKRGVSLPYFTTWLVARNGSDGGLMQGDVCLLVERSDLAQV